MWRWPGVVALTVAAALVGAAPAGAQMPALPIPGPLNGPLPRYTGAPATANPLKGPFAMQNPALAADGRNGSGLAAGNGAASPFAGPLGNGTTSSNGLQFGSCASIALDASDRLLALCNGPLGPTLRLIDPVSLATLSSITLPGRPGVDRTDTAGGTHFIVRSDGTLLVPTHASTLITVAVQGDALHQTGSLDLSGVLQSGERPYAVGAGFDGFDWVAGNKGTVVAVPRGGGEPQALALGEPVAEDIATDPTGTYVVTREALYRLRADASGKPTVLWRQAVPTGMPDQHSGRLHLGSGTPPAIVAGRYVAVADGVDPPHVMVIRIKAPSGRRLACATPVFEPGRGSVEAQLVVAGRSIVVSNAYGYDSLLSTEGGSTTVGGMTRIVVTKRGCHVAWTNGEISPSAQSVVSRDTGLLYTLEKPPGFPDAWNLAAIDWRSGQKRFAVLAGEGLGFNSDGSAVILAPDGSAYAGSFGGVTRFWDGA